jgi:hypothetical protein
MDVWLAVGLVGMTCILGAFFMVQAHYWSQDDWVYDFVNLLGSALLVANAWAGEAWPFLILNTIWGLLSLRDLVFKDRMPKVMKRF